MGAWGTGPFDNDEAGDWSYTLEDGGPELLGAALAGAEGDFAVVAAAAIVAHAWDVPVDLDDEVEEWVADQDRDLLRERGEQAVSALTAVLEDSEVKDLWEEAGDDS